VLDGGDGNDLMYGNFGTDYMYGGNNTDYMYGSYGSDYLAGQGGYDILYGEDGNDTLDGGDDGYSDYMSGGTGNDSFQIEYYFANGYYYNRDYPVDFAYGDSFYDEQAYHYASFTSVNTNTMSRL
jgi:Ca2+-binding RTX toxin-like protein